MAYFTTLTGQMTLKNEVKVKFESGFGGFGYIFGGVRNWILSPKTNISWWNTNVCIIFPLDIGQMTIEARDQIKLVRANCVQSAQS